MECYCRIQPFLEGHQRPASPSLAFWTICRRRWDSLGCLLVPPAELRQPLFRSSTRFRYSESRKAISNPMTTKVKDRIALGSAIAMGFGMSTGYPLGMMAAVGMPVAVLAPGTWKGAFKSAFGYYLAALWPMISGLERYIGRPANFV